MTPRKDHPEIFNRLVHFYETQRFPHLLLYGDPGVGKQALVEQVLLFIYGDRAAWESWVLFEHCAHQHKGCIHFIRNKLKTFARMNVLTNQYQFKTIVLWDADALTVDAQSALRRSIEVHSKTTRFILVAHNKGKIIEPILSRMCEVFVPYSITAGSLTQNQVQKVLGWKASFGQTQSENFRRELSKFVNQVPAFTGVQWYGQCQKWIDRGYSAMELLQLLGQEQWMKNDIGEARKFEMILQFQQLRRECRNETFLLFSMVYFLWLDKKKDELDSFSQRLFALEGITNELETGGLDEPFPLETPLETPFKT